METAARLARAGNRVISFVALLLIALMFVYGAYSLWDTWAVYRGAFVSGDLLQFKPSADSAGEGNPTLAELQAVNPDVRAWLTVDGTHIDYPVVQGETDIEYVNLDVYGEFALSGSIFMASRNSPDFSDPYTLVYGHHMDNGAMFGDVVEFTDRTYFEDHPTGTLYLPGSTCPITLFACVEADAYDRQIYGLSEAVGQGTAELLDYIKEQAVQYREIGIREGDRIIGLSTCAEAETNGRVIVFGRLGAENEIQEGGA